MIDLLDTFDQFGIAYITHGANVKRGWANVCCPFCGDDPSFHLGVNLTGGGWSCWRNRSHRGKSPRWLLLNLNVPKEMVDGLLGGGQVSPLQESLDRGKAILASLDAAPAVPKLVERRWPKGFHRIDPEALLCRGIVKHFLRERHVPEVELPLLARRFDLRYAGSGKFKHRVVFPIHKFAPDGAAVRVGWTGRDVTGRSLQRYYTDVGDHGKAVVYGSSFRKTMILVEGPFDALQINRVARNFELPIRAMAFLGTAVTEGQAGFLVQTLHRPGVEKVYVCMDRGAFEEAAQARGLLAYLSPTICSVPEGEKDAGGMRVKPLLRWIKTLI